MKVMLLILILLIPYQNGVLNESILYQKSEGVVLKHKSYVIAYDTVMKTTLWASYILTRGMVLNQVTKRTNNFKPDPLIPNSPKPSDYQYSGYDQGHLVNAQDMRYDVISQHESFYMTNMLPQDPRFNRGIWKKLEAHGRKWAIERGELLIVSGALFMGKPIKHIGENKIPVPTHCYKIFYDPLRQESISFIIKNAYTSSELSMFVVSIDMIENATRIDFLYTLEDELENRIEASISNKSFSLD
jgi:endonuclease G, mitochondrial